MQKEEIKKYVADLLNKGISLSDIQKQLRTEKNVTLTFLELRLIASEIENVDWSKHEVVEKKEEKTKQSDDQTLPEEKENETALEHAGKTVVELSKLARPGSIANGSVVFASGAKADWIIDQFGRLGLDKATGTPTQEDIKEFQMELQKLLAH